MIGTGSEPWKLIGGIMMGVIVAGTCIAFCSYNKARKDIKLTLLTESMNLIKKISWRHYFEVNLRAETGTALERPFGSPIHFYSWDQLLFNPLYLSKKPLSSDDEVMTHVTLGPQAKKPLHL